MKSSSQSEIFSSSILWKLQADYFQQKGIDAWRLKEVPSYITSNPTIANAYVQIVWNFRKDRIQLSDSASVPALTICELGAGSGEFAFHFIRKLIELFVEDNIDLKKGFRYILTDVVNSTLSFWKSHACFDQWLKEGILDIAYFDTLKDDQLQLQISGETISGSTLSEPLIVFSNYVFDSIPQDMFRIENGVLNHCFLSLSTPEDLRESEKIQSFTPEYSYKPIGGAVYSDQHMNSLLEEYKAELESTHLLFPEKAWKAIKNLQALSSEGILLISADKGATLPSQMDHHPPHEIQKHGSISMPINIHALSSLTLAGGGLSFLPEKANLDFSIFALLLCAKPKDYTALKKAYDAHINQNNPYDFYLQKRSLKETANQMKIEEVLTYMAKSKFDPNLFVYFLPGLTANCNSYSDEEKQLLTLTITKVWESYYSLGEDFDLAYQLACLFYAFDDYRQAIVYFNRSIEKYGDYTGTFYNMAVCYELLEEKDKAIQLLRRVIEVDSTNIEAMERLEELKND
jgi:tetratricopeptide (TPR) repeat protein